MKQIGIDDIESFDFIDPPDKAQFKQSLDTLSLLGALDKGHNLTEIGRVMAELPLEPKLSRMIIEAMKYGCVEQVCTIAAMLSGRNVMSRPKNNEWEADQAHREFKIASSGFLTYLEIWEQYEANRFNDHWARKHFLNSKALAEVREVRYQILRLLKNKGIVAKSSVDADDICKSVTAGLIGNFMENYSRHSYRRVSDGVREIYIHPSSVTFGGDPKYIVAGEIVTTSKAYARACQDVKPEWIGEIAPHFIREEARSVDYDTSYSIFVNEVHHFRKN